MFRRWRRRARLEAEATPIAATAAPRPSAADLRGEHIFELVNTKLAEFIGANGQWALVRRTPEDTDMIFDAVVTHQIASEVTRTILDERETVAVVVPEGEDTMALSWNPSPLVLWAEPVVEPVHDEPASAETTDQPEASVDATDASHDEPAKLDAAA
ncbi:hypothetical protein [Agromyces silvae]|uniref:hypothetical protein n=1 Tax=Agromyces silvae TaxID=3388266 RepID=UPI00280C3084|nr:hypothetical protein [Agromyces protaetiae]